MANSAVNDVIGHLRRALLVQDGTGQTDAKLLGRFIEERDETAFEALVRRHGPMVLGACRRLLRSQEDAEDAFQATFLVLVRKAAAIVPREMVGNWLYGVAHQTAIRVRAMSARRGARERQVTVMPEPVTATPDCQADLQAVLDQELSRLPDKYRVAILLCDLEGRTRKSVARQLGWPEGSVSSRLARGRAILAKRLTRHGVALSAEALAALLAQNVASASVPAPLLSATVKAATIWAAGQTAAAGLVSANVAAITEGVLTSMLLTKLKTAGVTWLVVCMLGFGVGASFLAGQTPGEGTVQTIQRKAGQAVKAPSTAEKKTAEGEDRIADLDEPAKSSVPGTKPRTERDVKIANLQRQIAELQLQLDRTLAQYDIAFTELKRAGAPQPAAKKEIRIFSLRNLKAAEVALTLEQLFNPGDSKVFAQQIRIATSPSTNTVIVQGSADDLRSIETIITRLEQLPIRVEEPAAKKS